MSSTSAFGKFFRVVLAVVVVVALQVQVPRAAFANEGDGAENTDKSATALTLDSQEVEHQDINVASSEEVVADDIDVVLLDEQIAETVVEEESVIPAPAVLPNETALLETYMMEAVSTLVEGGEGSSNEPATSARYWQLNTDQKKIYLLLKEKIEQMASGAFDKAEFRFTFAELFSQDVLSARYTAEDLGIEGNLTELVDAIDENGNPLIDEHGNPMVDEHGDPIKVIQATDEASKAVAAQYELSAKRILDALCYDLPYDFFWFDKTVGMTPKKRAFAWPDGYNPETGEYETIYCLPDSFVDFYFAVSPDYAPGYGVEYAAFDFGEDGNFEPIQTDITKIQSVATAVDNAAAIVSDNSALENRAKLDSYRKVICDAVSYNTAATESGVEYGNPWQLISVFDNNPATNVVCEGYAKAFKFLCDLSDFGTENISCNIVTGTMGAADSVQVSSNSGAQSLTTSGVQYAGDGEIVGAGNHMWNLVSVGDKNYLVDVTNCDDDRASGGKMSVGSPDKLFMVGAEDNSANVAAQKYVFGSASGLSKDISYTYDEDTRALYDAKEELTLAPRTVVTHTVNFDTAGMLAAPVQQTVVNGEKVSRPTSPANGAHADGYETNGLSFRGWYTKPADEISSYWEFCYTPSGNEAGCIFDFNMPVTQDITAYAVYEGTLTIRSYDVTYSRYGWSGTFDHNNYNSLNYSNASYVQTTAFYNMPEFLKAKPQNGYKFVGWSTSTSKNDVISTDAEYAYTFKGKTTLYALFEETPVRYLCTSRTDPGGTLKVESVANPSLGRDDALMSNMGPYEGDKITLTATPAANYKFVGYYEGIRQMDSSKPGYDFVTDYDPDKLISTDATYTFTITENTNIYALFEATVIKVSMPSAQSFSYDGKIKTGVAAGTGYTLSGTASASGVGAYTVTAKLKSGYAWTDGTTKDIELTWKINAANMSGATITNVPDARYTGKAIKPVPVVQMGGKVLKAGTDYTVAYKNNTKVGTATVTVTGKGNYTGSLSKTFNIVKAAGWERLTGKSGTGALGTQAQILSKFQTKTKVAVLCTNQDFKDALAAAALAGGEDAPIVTTSPKSLSDLAKSELERLGVTKVIIVGSTSDMSAKVESDVKKIKTKPSVVRVAASGASAKAVEAAKATTLRSNTVIIATQKSFKDALSISPYAYATHSPILYVEKNLTLSAATLSYIKSAKFTQAIIVGGPKAIPTTVEDQLASAGIAKTKQTRLAGKGCYGTSRAIAEWALGKYKNGASYKAGLYNQYTKVTFRPAIKFNANDLGISRGDGWKDALAGAALCGSNQSVLLLADTNGGDHTADAVAFIKANKASINKGYAFGGTQAVSNDVFKKLEAASR